MSKYYFFVSSLPSLQFSGPLPLSSAEFLERAKNFLSPEDFSVVSLARLDGSFQEGAEEISLKSEVLHAYFTWDKALRNELVRQRAAKLGRNPDAYLRPSDAMYEAEQTARQALALESPLESELFIERARWDYLEMALGLRNFDHETLVVYHLKLLSLERRMRLNPEKGTEAYSNVYNAILSQANKRNGGVTV